VSALELKKGEIYAIIGSNGSGKSTLLSSILKKTPLLAGQLLLNSASLSTLSIHDLAKTIAFVDSKFDGIEHLTVHDYVALGRTPYTDALGRLKEEDKFMIEASLKKLNLETFHSRETLKLSDGERQMVSIARAICQATPIILLDEPTAFLDYGNRKKLIGSLNKLAMEENKCIVFSTHDIDICIEEERINLLILNQSSKKLELHPNSLSKSEILSIGFNLEQE
jgi:iron complex transport system ATP-binding protein